MALTEEALSRIQKRAEHLIEDAKSLHLSNIAKSIEQQEGCQIFMVPLDEAASELKSTRWVATCQSYIRITRDTADTSSKKSEIVPICHHFIFYKTCPEDIEVERLRVAHCLAHCALHWPLGPRKKRLVNASFQGVDVYMVRFLPAEEEEANALASLLTAYQPPL